MGIIEEIKSLATTIGTDVKALRNDKANKNDFDRIVTALNNIADGLRGNTAGNTATGETPKANTIDDSFAQKAIKILKENHIPFLNSEEDNIEELKKWTQKVNTLIGNKKVTPDIKYVDGKTVVKIKPTEYFGVKVDCVCDSGTVDEIIKTEKEYTGVTSMTVQPIDYYGVNDSKLGKQALNFEFLEKMDSLDKLQVKLKDGWSGNILIEEIVDGNDYNIFDERLKFLYFALLEKKAKSVDSTKTSFGSDAVSSVQKYTFTGNVKLLVLNREKSTNYDGTYFLGLDYLYNGINLQTKPKYIAVIGLNQIDGFGDKINSEIRYEERDYSEEWNKRMEKVKETNTAIYRWDSTQNKYMFESVDTLENWIKEHPIDTL